DERRRARGQYLLTGSQNLLLTERVTESLAGRAAMLRLLPVSRREESGPALDVLPWEPGPSKPGNKRRVNRRPSPSLWKTLLRGGYPELVAEPDRDVWLWHSSYVQTYLE